MNIAICDDNQIDSTYVKNLIMKWNIKSKLSINIDLFNSAEEFLFNYDVKKDYDILFLDIEMKEMDGISLAKKIRKDNNSMQIIFITGYSDYIADGYDVEALHYLIKPIIVDKFYSVLERAIEKLKENEKSLFLNYTDQIIKLPLHDIVYIAVNRNYSTIYAKKEYTIKKTLKEIEKELDDRFFKVGRSQIINLKYVSRVTKSSVFFTTGQVIQIPSGIYEALNKAIIKVI